MSDDDYKRMEEAEKKAFELIDSENGVEFDEEQFQEFREAWRLVPEEIQKDLTIQLLGKLNFPQISQALAKFQKSSRTTTCYYDDGYYQYFVLGLLLNRTGDICNRRFEQFKNLDELVRYLQSVLKNTFLHHLIRTFTALERFDPDAETEQAFEVPAVADVSSQLELDELRDIIQTVLKKILVEHPDFKERCELLYAHAVEGKKFSEIATEFNARRQRTLSVDSYQERFSNIVSELKNSGELSRLNNEIGALKDQLSAFGVSNVVQTKIE